MKGYLTSYAGLFGTRPAGEPSISSIQIPLIQRDYAQGRPEALVEEVRLGFLEVLLDAIAGGEPVGLDFVYGKIDGTTLLPLDGQQRLTTLFLLHWYVASAADRLEPGAAWTRLSYETRASARLFGERLVARPLPQNQDVPSAWIIDQPWYLHVWRNDPTIQAMLVMIDAIHQQIHRRHPNLDAVAAWQRLTDAEKPAVSFYLLPLDDMESDEQLYIKMNSRGKPLTTFENFKARFEQDITYSGRADEFAHKIDGPWSDLLWPFHGGDNLVDDEFVSYLTFITEICELRDDRVESGPLGPRARAVFGAQNPRAGDHLDFLFGAFDKWRDAEHIATTMRDALSTSLPGQDGYDWQKVIWFGIADTDVFDQCLHDTRFNLQQSLLLYAFLLHLIEDTVDFPRRLRTLRNLVSASEVRNDYMPALIQDVARVIVHDDLDAVTRFNSNQLADERRKKQFLAARPELASVLFRLEDHPILRGATSAFELHGDSLRRRAEAFENAFTEPQHWLGLTGALLTFGDYQRQRPGSWGWQFGTSDPEDDTVWRYLLTGTTYKNLSTTRAVLSELLDGLASAGGDVVAYCERVTVAWLAERECRQYFDWRYYLVKYPEMRSGSTGIYYGVDGELGYSMCMLRTVRLSGYYRDPILLGVWLLSEANDRVTDPWFFGYEWHPRWLELTHSNAGMRCVSDGFELYRPEDEALHPSFLAVCQQHNVVTTADGELLLRIEQQDHGDGPVDLTDRVVAGAGFLRDLLEAGL
ncbi:DUF262 domain-containing protein [Paractinoplanes hotanensis]|uniref:DUF262 domain-containing protein n=1 Tax=Paractinoplanes hotanensis TaxID=2906497 RepID=A0ABT0YAI6_9ACTN|nr:DUF262 domain-containing protein [Actinoplanes hotanensis]MCM4083051.1 DUF262 domain-containing protein [Actinoplanes hotanensis]